MLFYSNENKALVSPQQILYLKSCFEKKTLTPKQQLKLLL